MGDVELEYCWQKSWGEMNGLESCLAGEAISTCGWIGCGSEEITSIMVDSQVFFCAAGGMGFPVTEIRDGKWKMTQLRRWAGNVD